MKRAIVSGANGFVGRALIKELLSRHIEICALDISDDNIPNEENVKFVHCDISKIVHEFPYVEGPYDVFYSLAWAGSAGEARVDYELQLNNAKWTADCLNYAASIGCKRFVCAGSIMEMETIAAVFNQGNKPSAAYIYGCGKTAAHEICKSLAPTLGVDLIWTFITNAYGVGETSPRFLNTTLRKIINGDPLQFTSATQNYDFGYIDDVARAFYLIGEKGLPFKEYLIGSGKAQPLRGFIEEIGSVLAPNEELLFGDMPFTGIDLPLETFDTAETVNDTGFNASISFSEGISLTMNWLKGLEATN
jgi:nucleoside-diphosphate-sugar epimerase